MTWETGACPDRIVELPAYWRHRAALLEPYAPGAAQAFRTAAEEFELAREAEGDEELNLTKAGAESGYHPDTIANILRENPELNVGRKHAPKIRRKNLPRKAPRHTDQPKRRDAGWSEIKESLL